MRNSSFEIHFGVNRDKLYSLFKKYISEYFLQIFINYIYIKKTYFLCVNIGITDIVDVMLECPFNTSDVFIKLLIRETEDCKPVSSQAARRRTFPTNDSFSLITCQRC